MTSRPLQRNARRRATAAVLALFAFLAPTCAAARERQLLDADWRFALGDHPEASAPDFDDADWRTVNLPHDWSIEGAPAADEPSGGAGGYFPTGIGWYRRTFSVPDEWRRQLVSVEFEGVYQHATVWINGHELGSHAYGYTPFTFDLTPHLNADGKPNVLAVRVDNSAQPNCRWYSGSGIYRHVWLEAVTSPELARRELFVHTASATPGAATIAVQCPIRYDKKGPFGATVEAELLGPEGNAIATARTDVTFLNNLEVPADLLLHVPNPRLWSPDSPALYTIVIRAHVTGKEVDDIVVDELRVPIGIRTVEATPDHGFELNGDAIKLFGGCVHHDNGPLGAAAFDRAETRRVELLKAAGFNAIRTSHNPPSTAFLTACDRLGMLVIDEAFDGWAAEKVKHGYHEDFAENWQADLESMIRRDRNHPSVVMWSIGNEVYERGKESGAKIAADMRAAVLALDATRPITAAANGLGDDAKWPDMDPYFASLDVAGYNYELDRIEPDHGRLPSRVIQITESFQNEAFTAWDLVERHPYLIGEFVWTSMDYLGEAAIGRVWAPGENVRQHWEGEHFPWHGAYCGDIDITGFRKPISHDRNIIWDRGEKLYAAVVAPSPSGDPWQPSMWALQPSQASWTWPGAEGRELEVAVSSRYPAVRLYLNDQFLGEQPTGREQKFVATFKVPYAAGKLRVVGLDNVGDNATQLEELTLATAGSAAKIRLTPDRTEIAADGQDLAFVVVEITDDAGALTAIGAPKFTYALSGPGEIAAVGSGDLTDATPYNSTQRSTYQGRALVVVRTTDAPGEITLTAKAPGLEPATITLKSALPK